MVLFITFRIDLFFLALLNNPFHGNIYIVAQVL